MGYDETPWIFTGRALYQLQFVKSSVARQYVPTNLKLVELFGYTLGGFYLARYKDTPAGAFDELVVLSGLVWNAPTSCAWAARVYVNNRIARDHGLKHVGLPSRLAEFTTTETPKKLQSWLHSDADSSLDLMCVRNVERRGWFSKKRGLKPSVCTFNMNANRLENTKPKGPRIRLALPSFSGCTPDVPNMLKYTCQLDTNVRPVKPVKLEFEAEEDPENDELMISVLKDRPLCAFLFDDMKMAVNPPVIIDQKSNERRLSTQTLAAIHF